MTHILFDATHPPTGCYVYVLLDPRKPGNYSIYNFLHEPFYVGKGSALRARQHISECVSGKAKINPFKINRIRKIITDTGQEPLIVLLETNLTCEQAYIVEIQAIQTIGRRDLKTGSLLNMTSGGDGGYVGAIRSEQYKRHQSTIRKGQQFSDQTKKRMSESAKKRYQRTRGENHGPAKLTQKQAEEILDHTSNLRGSPQLHRCMGSADLLFL